MLQPWRQCAREDCEDEFNEHGNGRDGGACHHRESVHHAVRRLAMHPGDYARAQRGGDIRRRCECPAFVERRRG